MPKNPGKLPAVKESLHARNLHRGQYDFGALCKAYPSLRGFVYTNPYGSESVDFSDPSAVKALNAALLKYFYGVEKWDLPAGYLCPPIPGRADYIHYAADLLAETNNGQVPTGSKARVLDIGTGANCIYPLIGHSVYGWQFVGTDIDPIAIRNAKSIISQNEHFRDHIELRLQTHTGDIFKGMVGPDEYFDLVVCNPPFHASQREAMAAATTKRRNLKISGDHKMKLNFGGQNAELWCPGGEVAFIRRMVQQSIPIGRQCKWFTSLVSKKETLPLVHQALAKANAKEIRVISMAQGQKVSRMVGWSFGG